MSDMIISATGKRNGWRITNGNRGSTLAITQTFAAACSRLGKLYGVGSGSLTVTSGGARPVLWFRNDDNDNDYYITDIIFGWNGGSTNYNRSFLSEIYYNTGEPSANNTSINAQVENIKFASGNDPGTLNNFTGYKWNGSSTGMTSGSGGFIQIPNRLGQSSGPGAPEIAGEIILGKGNSMEFRITPEEDGLFLVSVVFAVVPIEGIEALL